MAGDVRCVEMTEGSGVYRSVDGELGAETPFQFLAKFGDFHAGHDDKFAGDHFARLIIIGKLAGDATILAILVPAEAAVGDGFRTDELKAAEQGVTFRNLKLSPEDGDLNEFFVRTERFRHDSPAL